MEAKPNVVNVCLATTSDKTTELQVGMAMPPKENGFELHTGTVEIRCQCVACVGAALIEAGIKTALMAGEDGKRVVMRTIVEKVILNGLVEPLEPEDLGDLMDELINPQEVVEN